VGRDEDFTAKDVPIVVLRPFSFDELSEFILEDAASQ